MMAPRKRMLCFVEPEKAAKQKKNPGQNLDKKRGASKTGERRGAKTVVKRPRTSKQCHTDHDDPPQPGLTLEGLSETRMGNSDNETLIPDCLGRAPNELSKSEKPRRRGIVGIDVGTTYSGISFALTSKEHPDIEVNKNWPGAPSNGVLEKVETAHALPDTPGQDNRLKKIVWGYEVARIKRKLPHLRAFAWWKLLMGVNGETERFDDPLLRQKVGQNLIYLPEDGDYIDIALDWYGILYTKALLILKQRHTEDFLENLDLTWVISYPANWSEGQRGITYQAATKAGMGPRIDGVQATYDRPHDNCVMVSEPEAAAIVTIAASLRSDGEGSPFKPNTTALIVDLGGGTIDAKAYTIVRQRPLLLRDTCDGTAAWVGATSIYRAFLVFCQVEFGQAWASVADEKLAPGGEFCRRFEEQMNGFAADDDEAVFKVPLIPFTRIFEESGCQSEKFDVDEGCVRFTCDDMKSLFERVITGMVNIVDEQNQLIKISEAPSFKLIVLVGGLANCDYVLEKLKEHCRAVFGNSLEVRRPEAPWSAVVRGNALHGLKPFVVELRRSRHSLGFEIAKAFDAEKDKEEDSFHDPVLGKQAGGYLSWLVKKGQHVKQDRDIARIQANLGLEGGETSATIKVELFSFGGEILPEKIQHPGVQKVGEFKFTCKRLKKHAERWLDNAAICSVSVRARLAEDSGLIKFGVYGTNGKEVWGEGTVEYETTAAN